MAFLRFREGLEWAECMHCAKECGRTGYHILYDEFLHEAAMSHMTAKDCNGSMTVRKPVSNARSNAR